MLLQKQGSHLNEEISRVVLELQKDRYFETLYGRFASNMDKQISYVDMAYTQTTFSLRVFSLYVDVYAQLSF